MFVITKSYLKAKRHHNAGVRKSMPGKSIAINVKQNVSKWEVIIAQIRRHYNTNKKILIFGKLRKNFCKGAIKLLE